MKSEAQLCQALKDLWEKDFPLTRAMGMEVESFSDHVLTTHSSLEPYNTNTHGTAFGGSLYAIEALTAWSLLWIQMAHEYWWYSGDRATLAEVLAGTDPLACHSELPASGTRIPCTAEGAP